MFTKEPAKTDATYRTWDAENSMIMAWLVNAMEEDISANYMCYSTAKELWDNINQMYSDFGNQSQVYELEMKLGEFGKKIILSLGILIPSKGCGRTLTRLMNMNGSVQKIEITTGRWWSGPEFFKFLAGLNIEFDEVRGRISSSCSCTCV